MTAGLLTRRKDADLFDDGDTELSVSDGATLKKDEPMQDLRDVVADVQPAPTGLERCGPTAVDMMVKHPKTLGETDGMHSARAALADDHVHLVLVVDSTGRLITTIDRSDISDCVADAELAANVGRLHGRITSPTTSMRAITAYLDRTGRRRLAVVGDHGVLLGLICRKRSRSGYCTDEGALARQTQPSRGLQIPDQSPFRQGNVGSSQQGITSTG